MKSTRSHGWMATLMSASIAISGCGGKGGNPGVEPDSGGGGGSGSSSAPPPSEFVLEPSFPALNFLHDSIPSDWSKSCSVPLTASTPATKYLRCLMEAHELDLYSRDLSLTIKAPLAQCPYLAVHPYWFWTRKAGIGPVAVTINDDQSVTPPTHTVVATPGGGGASDVLATEVDNKLVCDTDYTASQGPNCCPGFYTKTVIAKPASGPTTTTVTIETWGGKLGNCAAGPGAATDWPRTKLDTPAGRLLTADIATQTASYTYSIKKPIDTMDRTSVYRANYHPMTAPVPAPLTAGAYYSATSADRIFPQPTYLFICYDYASESRARIALQIRKWNLVSELEKKSGGSWNEAGPEGTDPGLPEDKNDYIGWEDAISATPPDGYMPDGY